MKEETDFYYENDTIVLTSSFLLKRGFCCGNICRHCPYGKDIQTAAKSKKLADSRMSITD